MEPHLQGDHPLVMMFFFRLGRQDTGRGYIHIPAMILSGQGRVGGEKRGLVVSARIRIAKS